MLVPLQTVNTFPDKRTAFPLKRTGCSVRVEYANEEKSLLSNFVKSFIFFVTDTSNINKIKEGKIDKWHKEIGCLYLDVDWENYDNIPADYFKIWSSEYGEIEITKVVALVAEWS